MKNVNLNPREMVNLCNFSQKCIHAKISTFTVLGAGR